MLSIKDVQASLQSLGFDPKGIDGIAGPNTYNAVRGLQQAHGMLVDGVIDWEVLQVLFPAYVWSDHLGIRAMQIACTQVGIREATGNNDGLMIGAYLKAVGLGQRYSYCMAFDVWNVDQAARGLNIANPLKRTGGVMDQWQSWKGKKVLKGGTFMPGDIFILNTGKGHGHTGFIIQASNVQNIFDTVEGNTDDNGSSNGTGDFFRTRSTTSANFEGVIRLEN